MHPLSRKPFASRAKGLPAKRSEKVYGDENGVEFVAGSRPPDPRVSLRVLRFYFFHKNQHF